MAAFSGDVQALNDAVFGNPGKPDPRPAAIGNLDRITADAIRRTGEAPTFVAIENFGRADAEITSFPNPRASDIEPRSEEHTSELQSLMRISYYVFRLNKQTDIIYQYQNSI